MRVETKALPDQLKRIGDWDADIKPEHDHFYSVFLKSHSDKYFFYKSGYWWKAFIEIGFSKDDGHGGCSGLQIHLYDSVVCGGPIDKDPDSEHRDCYIRIPFDSKAEAALQERILRDLHQFVQ